MNNKKKSITINMDKKSKNQNKIMISKSKINNTKIHYNKKNKIIIFNIKTIDQNKIIICKT